MSDAARGGPLVNAIDPYVTDGGADAKSLLAHTLGPSGRSRLATSMIGLIPDRLSLPYPAEDLFWILLRKD